jgi:hypothetical protein
MRQPARRTRQAPTAPAAAPVTRPASLPDAVTLHMTLLRWFSVPSPLATVETFQAVRMDSNA